MYSRRQFLSKIALGGTAVFLALKSDALARVKEAVKMVCLYARSPGKIEVLTRLGLRPAIHFRPG